MKFNVVPHKTAAVLPRGEEKTVMIRVTSYDFIPLQHQYDAVLELKFLDVEDHQVHLIDRTKWMDKTVISTEQAQQIVAFAKQHADAAMFVVHCDAGKSRSPAIALAIADILQEVDAAAEIREANSRGVFALNRTVYDRVVQAAGLDKDREELYIRMFGSPDTFV